MSNAKPVPRVIWESGHDRIVYAHNRVHVETSVSNAMGDNVWHPQDDRDEQCLALGSLISELCMKGRL